MDAYHIRGGDSGGFVGNLTLRAVPRPPGVSTSLERCSCVGGDLTSFIRSPGMVEAVEVFLSSPRNGTQPNGLSDSVPRKSTFARIQLNNPPQSSQTSLSAFSFSFFFLISSSLTASLLFLSCALTADSYSLCSCVRFGGFCPKPCAIKREATVMEVSGLLASPSLWPVRGGLLESYLSGVLSKAEGGKVWYGTPVEGLSELKEGDAGVGGGVPGRSSWGLLRGWGSFSVSVSEEASASSSQESAGCFPFEFELVFALCDISSFFKEDEREREDAMVSRNF